MGDFNLDLLQVNSHKETDDFLNILGSSFFLPQILQPTNKSFADMLSKQNNTHLSVEQFSKAYY